MENWMDVQPDPDNDEIDGGAERVPERPPDLPGKGRTVGLGLIAVLALLVMAVPVAWGVGALVTLRNIIGDVAITIIVVAWAFVLIAFFWAVRAFWRRAA
jgi:ABC-type long-subunit fatty acid transport system fused permease/ATPase subunit